MDGAGEERAHKSPLRSIAIIVITLLAGLAITAIAYRKPIAQALLMRQLYALGLGRAKFAVGRFDAGSLEVENLSIDDGSAGGLEIDRIDAHFSPQGLFASRLDLLQISGVRLRGTLGETGLSFGPLDPLFESTDARVTTGAPAALPAAKIEIEDAQLLLVTARGPLRASLDLHSSERSPGQLAVDATLHADHALANLDAHLRAFGSPASLSGELEIEGGARGEFGPRASARAARLAAKAAFTFEEGTLAIAPEGCAMVQIESLSVKPVLAFSKPLDLCLRSESRSGIRIDQEGRFEARLELASAAFAAELRMGRESQRLTGELPISWIHLSGRKDAFDASVTTEAGRIAFATPDVELRDIRLVAERSNASSFPNGTLRIGEIRDIRRSARFPKLSLAARFTPRQDSIAFETQLENAKHGLVIEIHGAHDFVRAAGNASLHLYTIHFEPGQLQPADLFPIISRFASEVSGSIEAKGSGKWDATGGQGTVAFAITDAGAKTEWATIEHLNAVVELNDNGATPPDQTVAIGRLDFGLELTDGLIRYQVRPGGRITIESASGRFAGGELTTHGEIDLQSKSPETSLGVKGVDLARLFELVNLDGLSGSGTLEGELPLALVGREVEIRHAVLRSSGGPGIIRYRPASGPKNIAATDAQFSTALEVLENFHYQQLEVNVNGSATGTVVIQIHLAGANPDYRDGYPIEFNLSVDARLSDLLRTEIRIYEMPKKLEERLKSFMKRTS